MKYFKYFFLQTFLLVSLVLNFSVSCLAREIVDLCQCDWRLWLDESAQWENDKLYFPTPGSLDDVAYNPPSCGWEGLDSQSTAISVNVPGTVEEYVHELGREKFDYIGVSWWYTEFTVPDFKDEKRITINFDSMRLRSEIFIDEKIVSYSLLDGVPIEVDISDNVQPGQKCRLAVRITDPGGNFTWHDFPRFRWGDYPLAIGHGFGGITGPVSMRITGKSYIDDIYMQNTLDPKTINLNVSLKQKGEHVDSIRYSIEHKDDRGKILAKGKTKVRDSFFDVSMPITMPKAKLWSPLTPELYVARVDIYSGKRLIDSDEQVFGFRSFDVKGVGENAYFELNGKRTVIRTAISWGFWPENGMWPTGDLGEREIEAAKGIGLNMINYHRCIGRPENFNYADSIGLMTYEEPGGLISTDNSPFAWEIQRERILRMVKRDRSHPSLMIFNLMNEYKEDLNRPTQERDAFNSFCKDLIKQMHQLCPDTMITLTSGWDEFGSRARTKLHMRPYDNEPHYYGYVDFHRAGGPATYHEGMYKSPVDHTGYVPQIDELYFRGEEGAMPSTPIWPAIVEEISPSHPGWDASVQQERGKLAQDFYKTKGLNKYFDSLSQLLLEIGNVSYDHQGRRILLHRICDSTDGYAVNGWEKTILENFSGIVDSHRNYCGDKELILRHNRPLVIAVLPRKQIVHVGEKTIVDLHIVNELDIQGTYEVKLAVLGPDGNDIYSENFSVNILGGIKFAQLLKEQVELPLSSVAGMNRITVTLSDSKGNKLVDGYDDVLTIDYKSKKIAGKGAVYGTQNDEALAFLKKMGANVVEYDGSQVNLDWLVVSRSPEPLSVPVESSNMKAKDGTSGNMSITFFSGNDFTTQTRIGKTSDISLDVASGMPPDSSLGANSPYSVRWEGQLISPVSGEAGLLVESMESRPMLNLWIDGKNIADKYGINIVKPITVQAGKPVNFKLEYANADGSGDIAFKWRLPGQTALDPISVLEVAKENNTRVIILDKAEQWVDYFGKVANVTCEKKMPVWTVWKGGIFFVRQSPFFEGLPVNTALGWPYQAIVEENGRERYALKMTGEEFIAGAWQSIRHFDFGTSVGKIPFDRGEIVFSTLDIKSKLADPAGPADVARLLMCNFVNAK